MRLTPEELRRVADLARLDLDDDEADRLAAQLGAILERVDRLDEEHGGRAPDGPSDPGTPHGAAADHPPPRADVPSADPLAGGPEAMAPAWAAGFFTVPRLASHVETDAAGEDS